MANCLAVLNLEAPAIGAGSLVNLNGKIWLATAAHIGTNSPAFTDLSRWPRRFRIEVAQGRFIDLDLFKDASRQLYRMRFFRNAETGDIYDFILIDMTGVDFGVAVTVYELDPHRPEQQVGQRVAAYGFPHVETYVKGIWPPSEAKFEIAAAVGNQIKGNAICLPGYSGGPVINDQRKLVGMTFGTTDQQWDILSAEFIRSAAASLAEPRLATAQTQSR